jgi:hypothetical protein
MRRSILVLLVVSSMFVALPSHAASAPGGCPPAASGFVLYPINGEVGDPAPAPGVEPLWDVTVVAPFIEVFGSLQAGIDALGFADADDLYAFVIGGWLRFDHNGDSKVCVQDFPNTNGLPAFIWNFVDNNAKVPS